MKGVIETIPSFIYIIVAVAVGIFLFSLLYNYSDLFVQKQVILEGDKNYIAGKIAGEIENCWKQHRNGLDSVSGICKKLTIKSTDYFTEKEVTGFLDCQSIPNTNCEPENCSSCTSEYFDDQDKVKWFVENKKATIEISYLGFERVIKVEEILVEEVCEPYDRICDAACSYVSGICDKYCYRNNLEEGVPCDFDCVDYDKNGKIDLNDLDDVCDLDCYNNKTDIQGAYDIDCIWRNKEISDEICDPDTNGRLDRVCDPDCAKQNFICDSDCNGSFYDGNSKGLNDPDCSGCDEICNGICLPACKPGEDPDCPDGFNKSANLTECCGNQKCGSGENCENCPDDCPTGAICEDLNKICCPNYFDSDESGCSAKDLAEEESCSCSSQCKEDLVCTSAHCCPVGEDWDGNACVKPICLYPCTPGCTLPDKFDWSHVVLLDAYPLDGKNWLTPIKDQHVPGWCGSCWAFSAVGATEGTYNIEQNKPDANIDLSEQDLVSCAPGTGSCNGGSAPQSLRYIYSQGIVDENCFPYLGCKNPGFQNGQRHCYGEYPCNKCFDWSTRQWSISRYQGVHENSASIKRALVCQGPLSVAVRSLPHAVTLVGYDDSKNKWIMRNSWSVFTGWVPFLPGGWRYHINGYFYTPYWDIGLIYYVEDVRAP